MALKAIQEALQKIKDERDFVIGRMEAAKKIGDGYYSRGNRLEGDRATDKMVEYQKQAAILHWVVGTLETAIEE